jgi:hypothetical protein
MSLQTQSEAISPWVEHQQYFHVLSPLLRCADSD